MIVLGCLIDTKKRTLLFGRLMGPTHLDLPSPSTISNYIRRCEELVDELYTGDFECRLNAAIELYVIKPKGDVYRIRKNIFIRKNSNGIVYVPKIKAKDTSLINAGTTPIIFASKVLDEGDDYEISSYDVLVNDGDITEDYSGALIKINKSKVTLDKSFSAYKYPSLAKGKFGEFIIRKKKIIRNEGEKKCY